MRAVGVEMSERMPETVVERSLQRWMITHKIQIDTYLKEHYDVSLETATSEIIEKLNRGVVLSG